MEGEIFPSCNTGYVRSGFSAWRHVVSVQSAVGVDPVLLHPSNKTGSGSYNVGFAPGSGRMRMDESGAAVSDCAGPGGRLLCLLRICYERKTAAGKENALVDGTSFPGGMVSAGNVGNHEFGALQCKAFRIRRNWFSGRFFSCD